MKITNYWRPSIESVLAQIRWTTKRRDFRYWLDRQYDPSAVYRTFKLCISYNETGYRLLRDFDHV